MVQVRPLQDDPGVQVRPPARNPSSGLEDLLAMAHCFEEPAGPYEHSPNGSPDRGLEGALGLGDGSQPEAETAQDSPDAEFLVSAASREIGWTKGRVCILAQTVLLYLCTALSFQKANIINFGIITINQGDLYKT